MKIMNIILHQYMNIQENQKYQDQDQDFLENNFNYYYIQVDHNIFLDIK